MRDFYDKKYHAETILKKRHGNSSSADARMQKMFAQADDVFTFCKHCGQKRMGTLEQIKEPCSCGGNDEKG